MDSLEPLFFLFFVAYGSLCLYTLQRAIGEWMLKRGYQRECRRFEEALARGEVPERAPIRYSYDGSVSVEPKYLLRSGRARRQIDACRRLIERARHEKIPMFEYFFEGPRQ